MYTILGTTKSSRWALSVYRITLANPHVAMLLQDAQDFELVGKLPEETELPDGFSLVGANGTPVRIVPSKLTAGLWPYDSNVVVRYLNPTSALLSYGGDQINVPCKMDGDLWKIQWPDELGITAVIKCETTPTPDTEFIVPSLLAYPVHDVANALGVNNTVRLLLERHELVDEFYLADSDEEKIAIIVLALTRSSHVR